MKGDECCSWREQHVQRPRGRNKLGVFLEQSEQPEGWAGAAQSAGGGEAGSRMAFFVVILRALGSHRWVC